MAKWANIGMGQWINLAQVQYFRLTEGKSGPRLLIVFTDGGALARDGAEALDTYSLLKKAIEDE